MNPEKSTRQHLLHAARALALSFASIFLPLLGWATFTSARAHAWTWVQLGVAALAGALAGVAALASPQRQRVRRIALAFALLGLGRIAWAAFPRRGTEHRGGLVGTRYASSAPDTRLWWQGLPERETVALGAWVGLSAREYAGNGPAIDAAYAEIEREDLFERAESPLVDSWFFDREHFWLALPARRGGPVPLVVMVHGNGGTFELYPHLLARAATERGFAIAFPSNGFGFWGGEDAPGRIGRVVDAVAREVPVGHVALVGLSAGGDGIFAAALREPARYRALVGISAVFPSLVASASVKGAKVFIIHGTEDPRASIEGARRARDELVRAGVSVELDEEPGEDHLALLTARDRWVPRIFDFLARAMKD